MSSGCGLFSADDAEFLRRPLYGFFSAARGSTPPQPRPVWFELTPEGAVQIFTAPGSPKVRNIRSDSRASIVVSAPVGESERWIAIAGHAMVEPEGARALLSRLASRYWDLGDPSRANMLEEMLAEDWVRVVIQPQKIYRYSLDS
ncbi:pyridoxamine 5'-phosphate oxidase family protein [Mycolicibacterium canariasense]|nr:pyridoxamine 5'-phosphate oxidase family protein [Mycolicibacterium canariasense]MCV7210062.1 pyridoxamine 5'-phosphate oxidase family protein [Mycolicibacterium canariasense]